MANGTIKAESHTLHAKSQILCVRHQAYTPDKGCGEEARSERRSEFACALTIWQVLAKQAHAASSLKRHF